ncbi:hypothetical protein ACJX0J_025085, partial [Zea mays]
YPHIFVVLLIAFFINNADVFISYLLLKQFFSHILVLLHNQGSYALSIYALSIYESSEFGLILSYYTWLSSGLWAMKMMLGTTAIALRGWIQVFFAVIIE